jgi:GTP-binding protein
MKLPVVAIVGRPNVGKSSLLNCLARRRVSIVDAMPGVTRDRVSATVTHDDVTFELVDTGGIGIVDRDDLGEHVERQIERAVHDANAILLVTDVREGVTPLDREVARRLRERSKEIPVFLVVNKVDSPGLRDEVHEFHALGMGDPIPVSAREIYGTRDLLDRVVEKLWPTGDVETEPVMKLAVVGGRTSGSPRSSTPSPARSGSSSARSPGPRATRSTSTSRRTGSGSSSSTPRASARSPA